MKGKKGIIFAADIIEKPHLLNTIEQVSPYVDAIKIGNLLLYEHTWKIIDEIKSCTKLPIIGDLKFMDIPEMAERVAESAARAGIDGVMICGTAGSDVIAEFMRFIQMVFVFTEFTHCGGEISNVMADNYIESAITLRCAGIQVPGTKEERIREVRAKVGDDLMIICCGVGSQNYCNKSGDKTTFGSSVAAGADYEIIGRAIYSQKGGITPREAAMRAKNKILEVVNGPNN